MFGLHSRFLPALGRLSLGRLIIGQVSGLHLGSLELGLLILLAFLAFADTLPSVLGNILAIVLGVGLVGCFGLRLLLGVLFIALLFSLLGLLAVRLRHLWDCPLGLGVLLIGGLLVLLLGFLVVIFCNPVMNFDPLFSLLSSCCLDSILPVTLLVFANIFH